MESLGTTQWVTGPKCHCRIRACANRRRLAMQLSLQSCCTFSDDRVDHARLDMLTSSLLARPLIHRSAWKGNSPKYTFTILHSPSLIDLSQPHHRTVKSSMPHYISWSWIKIQVAEC